MSEKRKISNRGLLLQFNSEKSPLTAAYLSEAVQKIVKGQDAVIRRMAVSFSNHIRNRDAEKTNIQFPFLLVGNTGVGKSESLKWFAYQSKVPFITINMANIVPYGWSGGETIGNVIHRYLKENSEYDEDDLQYAVLFFDEADKVVSGIYNNNDVRVEEWRKSMQMDLMKLFNKDSKIPIYSRSGDNGQVFEFNLPVNNLLLCFGGAFSGIDRFIRHRLKKTEITVSKETDVLEYMNGEDLVRWGFMPELVGRMGKIHIMNPMTEKLLYEVISDFSSPENVLVAHRKLCKEVYNIDLKFSDEALHKIATMGMSMKTGVRAITPIIANLMYDVYYSEEYKDATLTIDAKYIDDYLEKHPNDKPKPKSGFDETGYGSGFAITKDGYIATNYHVIEDANKIRVRGVNGKGDVTLNARVTVKDEKNDLAIIKIDDKDFSGLDNDIPYALSQKRIKSAGEKIFILGYPDKYSMGEEIKVVGGEISAKSGFKGDITEYTISAQAHGGNSGGPLFNDYGNIIGVVNARLSAHSHDSENVSYAIKVPYLQTLLSEAGINHSLTSEDNLYNLVGKPREVQVKQLQDFVYIIEVE